MEKKLTKLETSALLGFQARDREIAKNQTELKNDYNEVLADICNRFQIKVEDLGVKYSLNVDSGLLTEISQPSDNPPDVINAEAANN